MTKEVLKKSLKAYRKFKRVRRREQEKKRFNFPSLSQQASLVNSYKPKHKYSVVAAVYQAEKYLDDFFSSILQQTVGFEGVIEIVVVDDGSTDHSLNICEKWKGKYPGDIKVLHKANGGAASARNLGLKHASHEWVTFIDPDDFICQDYFEHVDNELSASLARGVSVALVSCNIIFYDEANGALKDRHPLRYKFTNGVRLVDFDKSWSSDIQLSASSAFFDNRLIKERELEFPDIRPSFEDAFFIADYLLGCSDRVVAFLPSAYYFYRKRSDSSSLVDSAWKKKEKYVDQIVDGYVRLLQKGGEINDASPKWLQRTVLYDLIWHFRLFVNNQKNSNNLIPSGYRERYYEALSHAFDLIDDDIVEGFELAGTNEIHRLGILSTLKGHAVCSKTVRVVDYDANKGAIKLGFYYSGSCPSVSLKKAGEDVFAYAAKSRRHHFLGEDFLWEWLGWFKWPGNEEINVEVAGDALELVLGKSKKYSLSKKEVESNHLPRAPKFSNLPVEKKFYRIISDVTFLSRRFENAWLLMDRDIQADDNAEHLYRYIKESELSLNTWFVLRKSSHDWKRLEEEGFRLLEFGSFEHKLALLNARFLISSHADDYLFSVMPRRFYKDRLNYEFVFLQHGVIKDDLSRWLNPKDIRGFVCSSYHEWSSIVSDGNYKLSEREVFLTGMPRHDRLLEKMMSRNVKQKKTIVFMPTWRQSLVGEVIGKGNDRLVNPDFSDSIFYKRWEEVFSSPRLESLIKKYDIELVLFPHANLQPYLNVFNFKNIEVRCHASGVSIQDLFVNADVMVTDYSSVAFEMAVQEKPVLYYQFDRDQVFSGGHLTEKGYYEYDRDGFGPVAFDADGLIDEIENVVKSGFLVEPEYLKRMKKFIQHRDGRNCERVVNQILSLEDSHRTSAVVEK